MKTCLLIPNDTKDSGYSIATHVARQLASSGSTVMLNVKYKDIIGNVGDVAYYSDTADCSKAEYVAVIGGDGSFLDASRIAIALDIPIIGINLGRIGYLTELDVGEIGLLSKIAKGEYSIEERMLLSATVTRGGVTEEVDALALNEIVISHGNYSHLVDMELCRYGGHAVHYRADGLIVSTPSGSTAYSLSAGGPIIEGCMRCITATPICPHSFFARSLIFSERSKLNIKNVSVRGQELYITLDGREGLMLEAGDSISITSAEKKLEMITLTNRDFIDVLDSKMKFSDRK